jgi:hypothetical protein
VKGIGLEKEASSFFFLNRKKIFWYPAPQNNEKEISQISQNPKIFMEKYS